MSCHRNTLPTPSLGKKVFFYNPKGSEGSMFWKGKN